ncbi:cytochrome P450 [Brevibacillus sp. BC25]|uniref:cytochrome P450 n=1 Tax=Brevibacillus sp. BC25 TaxID=1144308 RepID=UPI0002712898|nr:cytochrome P450 [Brevibacillus sp. BC25]EJL32255.1 cytochrome P450 [Brevibacillus sp. BC25]
MNKVVFPNEISGAENLQQQFEPYAWYAEMRKNSPVHYDEKQQVWNVFLYSDVERVLTDYHLFSSDTGKRIAGSLALKEKGITEMDPPDHGKRRALYTKAFSTRTLQEWEPRIQEISRHLLEGVKEKQSIKILGDLATPMPVIVIADLLGVPSSDWMLFKQWSDVLISSGTRETYEDINLKKEEIMKEMAVYLSPIIQEKRENPAKDFLSDLTQTEYKGQKLTDREIIDIAISLLLAGNVTTSTLLFSVFYCFLLDRPGVYRELRENPQLVDQAIEEVLRFRPPAQVLMRKVQEDTDMFGSLMKKGEIVMAWLGSANRDENTFAQGDQFDIHRPNSNKHLSFGKGCHLCLGAPLSRLEAKVMLTEMIKCYSDISIGGFDNDLILNVTRD